MGDLELIQTGSREVNQVQSNVRRALGALGRGIQLERVTTSNLPTASAQASGKAYRVKDSGAAEKIVVCLEKADGSWAWTTWVTAP